jgi:hypothetical protein
MDVNKKYCQSCHYENNELTDMLLMYGQCYHVIRMQLPASREYAERFPERHHPGPRQLLI